MAETGVILTPDQRVRVFISSALGELAAERAAARRAVTGLHLVPVWYESGARPHPPRSMYRAYLEQSQVWTVSVTYCDGPPSPAWDAVGRLVGRVLATSLCNACFPCVRVWSTGSQTTGLSPRRQALARPEPSSFVDRVR